MNGLTSRQEWTHDHIARCTCGSWVVLTDRQTKSASPVTCTHINPAAMGGAA